MSAFGVSTAIETVAEMAPQGQIRRQREFVVQASVGLHLRPAALLARTAADFDCRVDLEHQGRRANGRSLLGIITLRAGRGARVTVTTEGDDAAAAMDAVAALFETNFSEHSTVAPPRAAGWRDQSARR